MWGIDAGGTVLAFFGKKRVMHLPAKILCSTLFLAVCLSLSAQISGESHYTSSFKATDSGGTASHYHEDPESHLHPETLAVKPVHQSDQMAPAGYNSQTDDPTGVQSNGNDGNAGVQNNANNEQGYAQDPPEENVQQLRHNKLLVIAAILFGMGALIGLYLLSVLMRNKETNKALAGVHGVLVASGLTLLIIYACHHRPAPFASIGLFSAAALGGLTVLFLDLKKKNIPGWLPIMHGLVALAGLIMLLVFMFG